MPPMAPEANCSVVLQVWPKIILLKPFVVPKLWPIVKPVLIYIPFIETKGRSSSSEVVVVSQSKMGRPDFDESDDLHCILSNYSQPAFKNENSELKIG